MREVAGAPPASAGPEQLLLDGQQRITSPYQVLAFGEVVETQDYHKKPIKRWYYIDILAALDPSADCDEAIISVPESRQVRTLHEIKLDVSTVELEWEQCLFPLRLIFGYGTARNDVIARQSAGHARHVVSKLCCPLPAPHR